MLSRCSVENYSHCTRCRIAFNGRVLFPLGHRGRGMCNQCAPSSAIQRESLDCPCRIACGRRCPASQSESPMHAGQSRAKGMAISSSSAGEMRGGQTPGCQRGDIRHVRSDMKTCQSMIGLVSVRAGQAVRARVRGRQSSVTTLFRSRRLSWMLRGQLQVVRWVTAARQCRDAHAFEPGDRQGKCCMGFLQIVPHRGRDSHLRLWVGSRHVRAAALSVTGE
jgi:hypothetical protein